MFISMQQTCCILIQWLRIAMAWHSYFIYMYMYVQGFFFFFWRGERGSWLLYKYAFVYWSLNVYVHYIQRILIYLRLVNKDMCFAKFNFCWFHPGPDWLDVNRSYQCQFKYKLYDHKWRNSKPTDGKPLQMMERQIHSWCTFRIRFIFKQGITQIDKRSTLQKITITHRIQCQKTITWMNHWTPIMFQWRLICKNKKDKKYFFIMQIHR